MTGVRETLRAAVDRLTRLGIDPLDLRAEASTTRDPALRIRFATPADLAAYTAEDRAKVEVADRRIPLRHVEHSAMYDRNGVRVLLTALVWEWEPVE